MQNAPFCLIPKNEIDTPSFNPGHDRNHGLRLDSGLVPRPGRCCARGKGRYDGSVMQAITMDGFGNKYNHIIHTSIGGPQRGHSITNYGSIAIFPASFLDL